MRLWTHRDYFRRYQLSAAQYGEILVAQVFGGQKLGDSQRCYDVEASADSLRQVLRAAGADEGSTLWPHTDDAVRVEVKSKLSRTPSGLATVVHCNDSKFDGMTHLAVVVIEPNDGSESGEEGRIADAWLLTRDAAAKLRPKPGTEQYIGVSQLRGAAAGDGVIAITSLVAAAAELPLEFLETDEPAKAPAIRKSPGVCGGSACVGNTRIPVWTLVHFRGLGLTDGQLLEAYPSLTSEGLAAAYEYATHNAGEIREEIARQTTGRNSPKERATA
jgi:uncharacterized protein (DUF433 family)